MVGVLEEDEGEYWDGILCGLESRVRSELVGGVPKAFLDICGEGHGEARNRGMTEGSGPSGQILGQTGREEGGVSVAYGGYFRNKSLLFRWPREEQAGCADS
jgi:hypothetical protein